MPVLYDKGANYIIQSCKIPVIHMTQGKVLETAGALLHPSHDLLSEEETYRRLASLGFSSSALSVDPCAMADESGTKWC